MCPYMSHSLPYISPSTWAIIIYITLQATSHKSMSLHVTPNTKTSMALWHAFLSLRGHSMSMSCSSVHQSAWVHTAWMYVCMAYTCAHACMCLCMYVICLCWWMDWVGWWIIEMPWCVTPQHDIDLQPLLFLFKLELTCSLFLYARHIVDIYKCKVHS